MEAALQVPGERVTVHPEGAALARDLVVQARHSCHLAGISAGHEPQLSNRPSFASRHPLHVAASSLELHRAKSRPPAGEQGVCEAPDWREPRL